MPLKCGTKTLSNLLRLTCSELLTKDFWLSVEMVDQISRSRLDCIYKVRVGALAFEVCSSLTSICSSLKNSSINWKR